MLGTIVVLLVVMWLLGMVSPNSIGNFIPILLVLAVIAVVVRLVSGRRAI